MVRTYAVTVLVCSRKPVVAFSKAPLEIGIGQLRKQEPVHPMHGVGLRVEVRGDLHRCGHLAQPGGAPDGSGATEEDR
jgi:hypothetical protein